MTKEEIIEKAYKTLAKKYHPDMQSEDKKDYSEEIYTNTLLKIHFVVTLP